MFEIGATLREARVRKGLTLQQVEEDTKIRVKYIQAMENEEFDVLPAPTYVKGFLRSYATYLGLDADLILDEYRSRHMPLAEHHPFGGSSSLRPRYRRRRSGLLFVALVAVLVLALIYMLGRDGKGGANGPTVNPSVLTPSPTLSASPRAARPSLSATPASTRSSLSLTATADCYVDVRRDSPTGTPVLQDVLAAGTTQRVSSNHTLYMTVAGDPANLVLVVNKQQFSTSQDGSGVTYRISRGKVARL